MTRDCSGVFAGTSARPEDPANARAAPADRTGHVREFMVRAWSELLGCPDLTEHSDFFARGGDWLLIARLVRRIGKEFGVEVPLRTLSRSNLGDQVALVHALLSQNTSKDARPAVTAADIRRFMTRQWSELLDCPEPADDSEIFDLGGDSLTVTRLVRRIGKEFGVTVSVQDLLAATTPAAQTRLVRGLLADDRRTARTLRPRAA